MVSSVEELAQQSSGLDDKINRAEKTRSSMAGVIKWDEEDVIWLDRIYKLNKSSPPTAEVVLNELNATSSVHGGPMTIKGWAHGLDGIESLEEGVYAHGGKMIQNVSREDTTIPAPYTWYFEASVQPQKSEKP